MVNFRAEARGNLKKEFSQIFIRLKSVEAYKITSPGLAGHGIAIVPFLEFNARLVRKVEL
jgi:hypothetical protein